MAAKKIDARAKAKRQKIILAVLGVVFLAVLAWQVPSVLKIMNKKPPTAATTPPPAAVPAPGAPATPAPGTPVSATTTPGAGLTDSDPAAQAAGGQLVTFDRFSSKDPFQQQALLADVSSSTGATVEPPATTAPSTSSTKPPPPPAAPAPTSARIAVNGSSETVPKGGTFPQSDPIFVLLSVSRTTAKIAISGGSLDSGGATVTLRKGKKLTLENTVDSARYVLLLVSTG